MSTYTVTLDDGTKQTFSNLTEITKPITSIVLSVFDKTTIIPTDSSNDDYDPIKSSTLRHSDKPHSTRPSYFNLIEPYYITDQSCYRCFKPQIGSTY